MGVGAAGVSMYSKPSDDDAPDLAIFVNKTLFFASSDLCLSKWSGKLATGIQNFKMFQGA